MSGDIFESGQNASNERILRTKDSKNRMNSIGIKELFRRIIKGGEESRRDYKTEHTFERV